MRLGLSVYGTMYSMGMNEASSRPRIRPRELIDKALELGLQGVEVPVELMNGEDEIAIGQYARDRQMFISLETVGFDPIHLSEQLKVAARMGVPTLRTIVMGAKLGGDRRPMAGRWKSYLEDIHHGLRKATEAAEKLGVTLAVENHQDIASEELIELCESMASNHFGIVFDTGSTLATADEPIEFCKKAAKYIKHVHLKDYELYMSEEGFRLVRCPLGRGAIDFTAMFEVFVESCPDVTMAIEVGALEAREVRVFSEDYWPDYPPRTAVQFARLMRFILTNAKLGEWRTPYELGKPESEIMAYEEDQLQESVAYLKRTLSNFRT
ncbi:sugar phosphate isomerase/epimerase family protein [Paenibacillus cremeus]|uniref:Sugar phosphate isomerase/epimerase n=1 Tax=Paenibacillus cremeus TaxID=2163881 RepID=A0A559K621_9BACL|nr:sugar phosphate isomerase/epimerase family protein [Paenibacillus cremeus]TVY07579.1 sugar phosphate isomerase/epimerase [Paenibacillus cremeus]